MKGRTLRDDVGMFLPKLLIGDAGLEACACCGLSPPIFIWGIIAVVLTVYKNQGILS